MKYVDILFEISSWDQNRAVPTRRVSGLSFQAGAGLRLARHGSVPGFLKVLSVFQRDFLFRAIQAERRSKICT